MPDKSDKSDKPKKGYIMDMLELIRAREVMDKQAKNLRDIVRHQEYQRLLIVHGEAYLYPKGHFQKGVAHKE